MDAGHTHPFPLPWSPLLSPSLDLCLYPLELQVLQERSHEKEEEDSSITAMLLASPAAPVSMLDPVPSLPSLSLYTPPLCEHVISQH